MCSSNTSISLNWLSFVFDCFFFCSCLWWQKKANEKENFEFRQMLSLHRRQSQNYVRRTKRRKQKLNAFQRVNGKLFRCAHFNAIYFSLLAFYRFSISFFTKWKWIFTYFLISPTFSFCPSSSRLFILPKDIGLIRGRSRQRDHIQFEIQLISLATFFSIFFFLHFFDRKKLSSSFGKNTIAFVVVVMWPAFYVWKSHKQ